MRRHHAGEAGGQPVVGLGVVGQDGLERAFVHRVGMVRVGLRVAVCGKVLAAVGHAGAQQAVHQALGQQGHHPWVAVEGAVADDGALAMVQVQHRGEAQVHAAGAQLAAQHIAAGGGGVGGTHRVLHPQLAQRAHRRQVGEAVGAKALHAAAFMVHRNQQVGADRLGLGGHGGELMAVVPVAAEQDQAAGQRMLQAAAVVGGEFGAGHVQDDGRMGVRAVHPAIVGQRAVVFSPRRAPPPRRRRRSRSRR